MFTRAVTGAIYVTVIVLSTYIGGQVLQGLMGLITLLMLREYAQMFKQSEYAPDPIFIPLLGVILYVLGIGAMESYLTPERSDALILFVFLIATAVIGIGIGELIRKGKKPLENAGVSIFGLMYILPGMLLIPLFSMMIPGQVSWFPLLGIFIMIWCSDTFAYLVGRKLGKNKMAERISPNKTWEGFFGGLLATVLAGLIIAYFQNGQPYTFYGILGILVATFGTIGDLMESMIKRNLGLKDSGNILPGHGGLLDRFDSVLFVMPVAFFYMIFFMKYLS